MLEHVTLAMIWVLSGLCVAYLMDATDGRRKNSDDFWIKGRGELKMTMILVLNGPLSLILGIVVMTDYLKNSSNNQHSS